jgi:hypothetical protein
MGEVRLQQMALLPLGREVVARDYDAARRGHQKPTKTGSGFKRIPQISSTLC